MNSQNLLAVALIIGLLAVCWLWLRYQWWQKSKAESRREFRQAWHEAMTGDTISWEDFLAELDAEEKQKGRRGVVCENCDQRFYETLNIFSRYAVCDPCYTYLSSFGDNPPEIGSDEAIPPKQPSSNP